VVGGAPSELVLVGSPTDPDFTITGQTSGAHVEVAVTAVNDGGESLKSTVVTVTVA